MSSKKIQSSYTAVESPQEVIKGGVQVVTPNAPPDPKPPSSWGTAVPSPSPSPSPSQEESGD